MDDIERNIAAAIVGTVLNAGHCLTVYDGGEDVVSRSQDFAAIMASLGSTDCDVLRAYDLGGKRLGWVALIWGNGCDLISDSGGKVMEALLLPAETLANTFE
jgi:hypothetical protein